MTLLVYVAANKLAALFDSEALHQTSGAVDYLLPSAALAFVGIGVLALIMDWRTQRRCPWC